MIIPAFLEVGGMCSNHVFISKVLGVHLRDKEAVDWKVLSLEGKECKDQIRLECSVYLVGFQSLESVTSR